LLEYTNRSAIAIAAVKPDNFARVGVDGSIDLDPILRELIMAVKAPKEVRTRCSIVLKPCTAKARKAGSNASRIQLLLGCGEVVTAGFIPKLLP
jgi:hypothetical protein